jgi:type I restriction enzyme S subunit
LKSNYKKLGQFIEVVNIRNTDLAVEKLLGVSIRKVLMPSIANTIGTNMKTYKIIKRNQFAYGPVTSRNGDKISIALLEDYDDAIISQAYVVFEIIDKTQLLPEYAMMWFRRPEFDRYARFKSHGSARETFDWDELCETELPIPSIEKQQKIVNEYNTITKRIALNEQLNQKLEETAQTLYKHWFVDFEFPNEEGKPYKSSGGKMVYNEELDKEIPEGWEDAKLSELLEVKYGKDYKHLKSGDIPLYGSGGIMGYYDKALYEKPSILIPRKGSLDNILFVDEPFWSVDTMFYTIINNESYTNYLFHFLKKIDYYSLNVGSAVPSMTTKVLNDITILLPSSNTLGNFEALTSKMLRIVKQNDRQQFSLIELASTILSKMSKEETKTVVV